LKNGFSSKAFGLWKNPRHVAYRTEFCGTLGCLFKTHKTGTVLGENKANGIHMKRKTLAVSVHNSIMFSDPA
jgi:hypothetical protein